MEQQEIEILVSPAGLVRLSIVREIISESYPEYEDFVEQSLWLLRKLVIETAPDSQGNLQKAKVFYLDPGSSKYVEFQFPFWFDEIPSLGEEEGPVKLYPLKLRFTRVMEYQIERILENAPGLPQHACAVIDAAMWLFTQFRDGKIVGRKFFMCPLNSEQKIPIAFPLVPASN